MKSSLLRPVSSVAGLVLLVLSGSACEQSRAPGNTSGSETLARVLSVRGIVRQLPQAPGVPFLVEHEAIPGFVDISGRPAPMDSMTMPFALADGSLVDGVALGDKIAFELLVDWQASPPIAVRSVEILPSETVLELGRDAPDSSDS